MPTAVKPLPESFEDAADLLREIAYTMPRPGRYVIDVAADDLASYGLYLGSSDPGDLAYALEEICERLYAVGYREESELAEAAAALCAAEGRRPGVVEREIEEYAARIVAALRERLALARS